MKFMNKQKKRLAPIVLATMLLAPSVLLSDAYAQGRRDRDGDRRDGQNRNDQRVNDNWSKNYIGKISFKLEDDPTLNAKIQVAKNLTAKLKTAKEEFEAKKVARDNAKKEVEKIEKAINKLTKETLESLQEKNKLKAALPGLQSELGALQTQVELAQVSFDSIETQVNKLEQQLFSTRTNLKTKQEECNAAPTDACKQQVKQLTKRANNLQAQLDSKKPLKVAAKTALDEKTAARNAKNQEINQSNKRVAAIDKANEERAGKLSVQQNKLTGAKTTLLTAAQQLSPVQAKFEKTKKDQENAVESRDQEKFKLVTRIMRMNRLGADEGIIGGDIDGVFLAELRGISFGQEDGDRDGSIEGTTAGKRESYARGKAQGEIDGRQEGQRRGSEDGIREGAVAGNTYAAQVEGREAGNIRAENSNAAQVGTTQGRSAGMSRAVKDGTSKGNAIGEAEAINDYESRTLKNEDLKGQFAGAFAPVVPRYPGFNCVYRSRTRYSGDNYEWRRYSDYRVDSELCPNFIPRHPKLRKVRSKILKQAFVDAYLFTYRRSRRAHYVERIDNIYLGTYENSRSAAFEEFRNRAYPEDLEAGRRAGYDQEFGPTYAMVKERVFKQTEAEYRQNPDRGSNEYKSTYTNVEGQTYTTRYNEIKNDNYNREEDATYRGNVAAQTEKFRKIRKAQVQSIYENNSVLKYVGGEIADGGVNGIAKADGVFQPGETIFHNVIVRNYGKKAAQNAKVTLENGQSFKLPTIPAGSQVIIKGAGQSKVAGNATIGGTHKTNARVYSPLTSEASVQGRHYANTSTGQVNLSDTKKVQVQYPLSLSALATDSELLFNQENGLKLSVSNNSKRKYSGPLTINLSANASGNIVKKGFAQLNSLSGTTNLDDASILVNNTADLYSPITITAKIQKQGVTLGVVNRRLDTMAKIAFADKKDANVILADGQKSSKDLVELMNAEGGMNKVSILDTSLAMNRNVLAKGLNKKTVLVIDNGRGSSLKGVEAVVKNSTDSAMIFVDDNSTGINTARRASTFKDASVIPAQLKGINGLLPLVFTNKYQANLKDTTVAMQATNKGYKSLLKVAELMKMNNADAVAIAKNEINKKNFFNVNEKIQAMTVLSAGEILNVNAAYIAQDSDKFEKMLEKGDELIFQAVLNEVEGEKVKDHNESTVLTAAALYYNLESAMDKFDPLDDTLKGKIENAVEARIRNVLKGKKGFLGFRKKGTLDALKKHDKGLYNKLNDNKYIHLPFDLENDDPNDWSFISRN
ncbi:hypothetical protein OAT67_06820 [Bacteriovoracaceae bacterium]|nr:hypothetical protein [Bacteriovoracaceae bacterium]